MLLTVVPTGRGLTAGLLSSSHVPFRRTAGARLRRRGARSAGVPGPAVRRRLGAWARTVDAMQDPAEVGRIRRRGNRAVVAGLSLMAVALFVSTWPFAPMIATTIGALVGFVLLLYGVHLGWTIFYNKDPDGPSS